MVTINLTEHEAWVLTETLSRVIDKNSLKDDDLTNVAITLYDRVMEERSK